MINRLRQEARNRPCQRVGVECAFCEIRYEKRADRVRSPDYCSLACRKSAAKNKRIAERGRTCEICGAFFVPRIYQLKMGQGRFCSNKCAVQSSLPITRSAESRRKSVETWHANGNTVPSGSEHPLWAGGPCATRQRRTESGKDAAYQREFRARNPQRVREWAVKRSGRKLSRLPWGTIPRLLELQKWKCALCHKNIRDSYHVDHIIPLKLNGKHDPSNLQILCPSCNLRKSAKHPVDFAQERGLLL